MRILILGLGGIGQRHARNLRALLGPDLDLLAHRVRGLKRVVTPQLDVDDGDDVEKRYAIRVFTSLDDALAERPDAAIVANPTSKHVESALRCVRAGCDVFIEKPLAGSLTDVDALCSEVDARSRIVTVGYQLRFHPGLQRLAQLLEAHTFGQILSVRAIIGENLPSWHRYEDYRSMYAARSDLGGGVVLSQIHEFDYLYSLFGRPTRVFAIGGHWSSLEVDVEDTASILMEYFADGRPLPIHLHQDYLQKPAQRSCEIIGDRGRALLDFMIPSLTTWSQDGAISIEHFENFERNQLFMAEMQHFLTCVSQRRQPIVDLREGLESLEIALAVKESIATRSVVELARRDSAFVGAND